MKKLIFMIIAINLFCGCMQNPVNESFLKDKSFQSLFTKETIKEFGTLVLFLDSHLMKRSNTNSVSLAYKEFSEELYKKSSVTEQINIPLLDQQELEELILNLSREIFSEIWINEFGYDYITKDTLSVFLNINMNGNYIQYLNHISNESDELAEYVEAINEAGFIGPSLNAFFPILALKLDFDIPRHRLLFAIHYYTMIYEKKY